MNAAVIILIIFLILLVLVGIGVGLYFAFRKKEEPTPKTPTPPGTTPTPPGTTPTPPGTTPTPPGATGVRPPPTEPRISIFVDYPGIILGNQYIDSSDNPASPQIVDSLEACKDLARSTSDTYPVDFVGYTESTGACQLQQLTPFPGNTCILNLLAKGSTGATGTWYRWPGDLTLDQQSWVAGLGNPGPVINVSTEAVCRQTCKKAIDQEQVIAVYDDQQNCWCAAPKAENIPNRTTSWVITDAYTLV